MGIFPQKNTYAKWQSSFCINFKDLGTIFILKACAVLTAVSFTQEGQIPLTPLYTGVMTANGQSRLEERAGMWRCISGHFRTSLLHSIRFILSSISIPQVYFHSPLAVCKPFSLRNRGKAQHVLVKKETLCPCRGALVSEPWEMGDVTTQPGRVSNGNWKQKSRRTVQQLTPKCFSICKAVLNPQETLRINFVLSFLFA